MNNFARLMILLTILVTTSVEANRKYPSGEEIKNNYKILDSMNISAKYENGMILIKYADIYKINGKQCVIVSRLNNESNFGGYEDIIYFKNRVMLKSLKRSFYSIFLDEDAKIKSDQIKYGNNLNGKEVQIGLKEDFIEYRKKFNKKTLAAC